MCVLLVNVLICFVIDPSDIQTSKNTNSKENNIIEIVEIYSNIGDEVYIFFIYITFLETFVHNLIIFCLSYRQAKTNKGNI